MREQANSRREKKGQWMRELCENYLQDSQPAESRTGSTGRHRLTYTALAASPRAFESSMAWDSFHEDAIPLARRPKKYKYSGWGPYLSSLFIEPQDITFN